jgi:hypothetical protein
MKYASQLLTRYLTELDRRARRAGSEGKDRTEKQERAQNIPA